MRTRIYLTLVVLAMVIVTGCVQTLKQQAQPSYKSDADLKVEDVTDEYPKYLNEPSGVYDAYCHVVCSSEDPLSKQRVSGYNDIMTLGSQHAVYMFVVTQANPNSFKLITTEGADVNYLIDSNTFIVPLTKERNKYVLRVVVDYTTRLRSGADEMHLQLTADDVQMPFTIIVRRAKSGTPSKQGFDYITHN